MGDGRKDPLGILTPKNKAEDDPLGIKKKEETGFPLLYKREKTSSMPAILPSKERSKAVPEQTEFTQVKNYKKQDIFAPELTDEEAEQEAVSSFQRGDYIISPESKDPVGDLTKQIEVKKYSYPDYKVARKKIDILNDNYFQNGDEARNYLQKDIFGKSIDSIPINEVKEAAKGNLTKELAVKKYEQSRNVKDALQKGRTLEEAAMIYAANSGDEQVKYFLESSPTGGLGGFTEETSAIPLAMRGEKMLQFLMNKDLRQAAENNPELKTQIKEEIYNFPNSHPEYATKMLAEMIAAKRDEKGLNNSFVNIVGKESTDKIMDELIESGDLPSNYQFLYKKAIRPKLGTWRSIGRGIGNTVGLGQLVNDAPIPTSGIVERFGEGWENTYRGIAESVATLPSIGGLPDVRDAFQPEAQQMYQTLKEQYETPAFEPKSTLGKITYHGGAMIPFVMGLVGGTTALRAANIIKNPALASATMMVLATHSDNEAKARALFPRNDFKQFVYTATLDGLNASLVKLLPGQQIPRLLKGSENTIANTLKRMVDGEITTSAAKSTILNLFGETIKGSVRGGEFMGALGMADDMLTQVLQGKNIDFSQSLEQGWEGFKLGLISTIPLAGTEAFLKSNKGYRQTIMSMAENPDFYKRLALEEGTKSPEFEKVKDDIIENIDYVSNVYKETENTPVKDREQFVINSLLQKIKTGKAERATDPTIKKIYQEDVKKLNEIKEGVLKGIPEEKIKDNQAIKEVKEFYDEGFLGKGSMELLEKAEGEEGKRKFDEGKVKSYLKYVAEQANNINEKGEFNAESDARKSVSKQIPSQIIDIANEMYPEFKKIAEEADIDAQIEAKKISEPIELSPELPEGYELPEKSTIETEVNLPIKEGGKDAISERSAAEVPLGETPGDSSKMGEGISQPKEPTRTQEEGKAEGKGEEMRLTHADTERMYQEAGLPERLDTPIKSRDKLESEAQEKLDNGYDFDKVAENVMDGKYQFEDVDQLLFSRKVADLKKKQSDLDINTPEFDNIQNQIEKLSRASDVSGTITGRALQARKKYVPVEESISDFVFIEKESSGVDVLTEKQKETVKREYDEINEAKRKFEDYVAKKEAEFAEKEANLQLQKERPSAKKAKKTHEDFVAERKSLKDKLKEARKEHEDYLKSQGIHTAGIGRFTIKEAKIVGEMVFSYAHETALTLKEIASKVLEEIKDIIPDATEKDVIDVVAGVYNERKITRNELMAKKYELSLEAKLINKLELLEKGAEPKSEKKKVERNREIKELRSKIKPYTDLSTRKNRMKDEINEIERKLKESDFEKQPKKEFQLDEEGKQLRDKLNQTRQKRDIRVLLEQRKKETGKEKGTRMVTEYANVPRSLMTIGDFSGLLRQNIFFSVGHPLMTKEALPEMFKSFVNQKIYDRWFADLKDSKRYEAIKESKLAIADTLSHDLTEREEAFMSTVAEKIPLGIGKIVKGSERSYTMLLNKMRVDMFNYFSDAMESRGLTIENSPKKYKAMAEYINNATGRSDFGKTLNRVSPLLNSVFFSPRLIASRINMLTYWAQPRFWKTLPKEARIDYFRNWISLLAVGGSVLALAKLGGADVEDDPRSSDFGKIKSGNTRWDIWGGAQPYMRVLAQVVSGQRKSTNTGKLYELGGDDIFGETRAGVVSDFFRNKLAPVPGAAIDILSGRTSIGDRIVYDWSTDDEKEIAIKNYILQRVLPMTITGTHEAMKDQGVKALITVGVPSVFGVGTQTYEPPKPKQQQRGQKTKKPQKND